MGFEYINQIYIYIYPHTKTKLLCHNLWVCTCIEHEELQSQLSTEYPSHCSMVSPIDFSLGPMKAFPSPTRGSIQTLFETHVIWILLVLFTSNFKNTQHPFLIQSNLSKSSCGIKNIIDIVLTLTPLGAAQNQCRWIPPNFSSSLTEKSQRKRSSCSWPIDPFQRSFVALGIVANFNDPHKSVNPMEN